MGFLCAIRAVVANAVVFRGRASRAEFWWWGLAVVAIWIAVVLGAAVLEDRPGWLVWHLAHPPLAAWLFALAVLLPSISVAVRRLHDLGRSGWWLTRLLAPAAATVGVLILMEIVFGTSDRTGTLVLGVFTIWLGVLAEIGVAILLVTWLARQGDASANRFGPDPNRPDA